MLHQSLQNSQTLGQFFEQLYTGDDPSRSLPLLRAVIHQSHCFLVWFPNPLLSLRPPSQGLCSKSVTNWRPLLFSDWQLTIVQLLRLIDCHISSPEALRLWDSITVSPRVKSRPIELSRPVELSCPVLLSRPVHCLTLYYCLALCTVLPCATASPQPPWIL